MEEKIVREIPIEEIVPNPYQPRKVFSEKSLEELKNSIERLWSATANYCEKKRR